MTTPTARESDDPMQTATAVRPPTRIDLAEPDTPAELVVQTSAAPREHRVEVLPAAGSQMLDVSGAASARRHDPRTSQEFTPFAASEEIGQLVAALTAASIDFEEIERNREADVQSKREGAKSFKYRYATLGEVIRATRPALSKNGLALLQMPAVRTKTVTVITLLTHTSGEWIRNDLPVVIDSLDPQTIGKAISYMRRYAQLAMLNLAPEDAEDTDCNESSRDRRPDAGADSRSGQGPVTMPHRSQPTSPPRGASASAQTSASSPAAAPTAATPDPAPGITIEAIEPRAKADKTPYWVVAFSNKVVACTFRQKFAEQLEEARKRGARYADIVTTQKGNWLFLDSLEPMGGAQ